MGHMSPTKTKHMKQPTDSDPLSAFFSCPSGHKLPHRTKKGRCAPFDCVDAKGGAHAVVRTHERQNHSEALAFAEETAKLVEMKDRMAAWNAVHPLPEVLAPPKTNSVREYMEKRLEQSAPLALERRIRIALLDPGHQGEAAARELLNRSGFSERPETRAEFSGPVFIVGSAEQVRLMSPYAVQGKQLPREGVVDGTLVEEVGGSGSARATPAAVAEGESDVVGDIADSEAGSAETPSDEDVEPGGRSSVDGVRSPEE